MNGVLVKQNKWDYTINYTDQDGIGGIRTSDGYAFARLDQFGRIQTPMATSWFHQPRDP